MALLSADSFNRASSSTSLGSTDGAGSLDPRTWTARKGTWGISFNMAYSPVLVSSTAYATVDLGTGDVDIQSSMQCNTSQICGLVFRLSDVNNYWILKYTGTTMLVHKVVAGTPTATGGSFSGNATNDVYRVVCSGSSIKCYRNGVLKQDFTDSFNSTATHHGLYSEDTGIFHENWTASSTTSATAVTGTQATETDTGSSGSVLLNTIRTGTQALETDTATSGAVPVDTIVVGAQAIETDSAPVGTMTGAFTVVGGMALESDVGRSGFTARPIAHTCARRVWLELGALSIDLHNETGGWFVTSFDPGSPAVREVVNVRPDQDGVDDLTRFMGARVISADITALTAAGAIIDDVAVSFAPFMVPSVRPELHYVLDRPGLPERVLTVRASQYAFKVDNDYQRDIQLQWVASDPVAYDPETHTATAWAGSSVDAGRTYDLTYDRTYPTGGAASPTTGHLYNAGDVPVRPLLRIWGPATGPAVTFDGDGGDGAVAFVDSYTISGGHYVEVDCDQRAAYLDGHRAQSVLAFLDWSAMTTAGWPTILPRLTANMHYTGTTTTDATQVIAYWHDGYLA